MNKETLEEAAENHINNDLDLYESLVDGHISYNVGIDLLNNLFIEGAKWMQERMYSEEEVINFLYKRESELNSHNSIFEYQDAKEWFEQFKKGRKD